jgi:hypothetical protein
MVSGKLMEFERYFAVLQDLGKTLIDVEPLIIAAAIHIEVGQERNSF